MRHAYPDAYPHTNADAHSNTDTHAYPDTYPDTYTNAYSNANLLHSVGFHHRLQRRRDGQLRRGELHGGLLDAR